MQIQVTTCNKNLKNKLNNHDREFPKILKVLFFFNLRWIALFSNSCFQILVFDKRQVKWLQTGKRKFQEKIPKSLEEAVKEHRGSFSQLL